MVRVIFFVGAVTLRLYAYTLAIAYLHEFRSLLTGLLGNRLLKCCCSECVGLHVCIICISNLVQSVERWLAGGQDSILARMHARRLARTCSYAPSHTHACAHTQTHTHAYAYYRRRWVFWYGRDGAVHREYNTDCMRALWMLFTLHGCVGDGDGSFFTDTRDLRSRCRRDDSATGGDTVSRVCAVSVINMNHTNTIQSALYANVKWDTPAHAHAYIRAHTENPMRAHTRSHARARAPTRAHESRHTHTYANTMPCIRGNNLYVENNSEVLYHCTLFK